jgi:hypothetical protein
MGQQARRKPADAFKAWGAWVALKAGNPPRTSVWAPGGIMAPNPAPEPRAGAHVWGNEFPAMYPCKPWSFGGDRRIGESGCRRPERAQQRRAADGPRHRSSGCASGSPSSEPLWALSATWARVSARPPPLQEDFGSEGGRRIGAGPGLQPDVGHFTTAVRLAPRHFSEAVEAVVSAAAVSSRLGTACGCDKAHSKHKRRHGR